ncbi:MAG: fumarylacetoacetate hydrolase family protein [Vicinamibacterales bacterium]|nr:fumarylacetoacetate hydrolase family protein [Vicinamibacterales bacterium]
MKLLSYLNQGKSSYGIHTSDGIVDLGRRLGTWAPTLKSLLAANGLSKLAALAGERPDVALADVVLLPVIPDPANIICVGLNYEEHRAETARPTAMHPTIFTRTVESLQAHGQPLLIPRESDQFDYEGELAVVVGRAGRRIAEAHAWEHIAGISCFNDASVRDWQYHTHQFTPGKCFPLTGALGPALVTTDELPDNRIVRIETRLNGKIMQQADTGQMLFSVPRLLAYISTFMKLQPGDVIATGTPGGVGAKRKPPVWMRDGDVVEVEIERVGLLSNSCRKEGISD